MLYMLLTYVTKATNEVTESLTLLYHARRNADLFPLLAADRRVPERRARLFIHKLLNDISGRVMVSITMSALCVLGGEAEVFTNRFFFVFVNAAVTYAQRLTTSPALRKMTWCLKMNLSTETGSTTILNCGPHTIATCPSKPH